MRLTGQNGAMLDGTLAAGQEDPRHGRGRGPAARLHRRQGGEALRPVPRDRQGTRRRDRRRLDRAARRAPGRHRQARRQAAAGPAPRPGDRRRHDRRPASHGPPRRPPDPPSASGSRHDRRPERRHPVASPSPTARPPPPDSPARYLVPALVAAAVAVGLGVYGKVHDPAGTAFNLAGFSSTSAVKSWLGDRRRSPSRSSRSSRRFMVYGRLPGPCWSATLHRWSGPDRVPGGGAGGGALPLRVRLPDVLDPRDVAFRSSAASSSGPSVPRCCCSARSSLPGWLLPLVGGLVFIALTVLWLTSALWFFRTFGVTT